MRAALDAECEMAELKCVGICSGPVVVVRPESASPIVLSKLRTKRQRKHVLRVVADDRGVPPELADRVVRSASTVRKVRRALRDIA